MPPFLVRPRYVSKPWGGRRLAERLGRQDLPEGPIGESWEVVDIEGATSIVETGPHRGRPIAEAYGAPFPLLLKVLDAREDLSVQVHPDEASAEPPKEEAWVALSSEGAVAVGDVRGRPPPAAGAWLDHLERVDLKGPSDRGPPSIVHVPAGTVHAILADSLVWEVQTPVDVTWRLDDHGRVGLDGRPRALHLDEAAAVLSRGPEPTGTLSAGGRVLEGRRLFVATHPAGTWAAPAGCAAFFLAGGRVRWRDTNRRLSTLEVPPGRTAVLTPEVVELGSDGWMIVAGVRAVPFPPSPR